MRLIGRRVVVCKAEESVIVWWLRICLSVCLCLCVCVRG